MLSYVLPFVQIVLLITIVSNTWLALDQSDSLRAAVRRELSSDADIDESRELSSDADSDGSRGLKHGEQVAVVSEELGGQQTDTAESNPLVSEDMESAALRELTQHPQAPSALKSFECTTDVCSSNAHVTVKAVGIKVFDVSVKDLAARLCPRTCGTSGNASNTQIKGLNTGRLCQSITKNKAAGDHAFRLCRYDP